MEDRREVKTVELMLLGGSKKRFVKDEIISVYERDGFLGGKETVVQVKSGYAYAVIGSVAVVNGFIKG